MISGKFLNGINLSNECLFVGINFTKGNKFARKNK